MISIVMVIGSHQITYHLRMIARSHHERRKWELHWPVICGIHRGRVTVFDVTGYCITNTKSWVLQGGQRT